MLRRCLVASLAALTVSSLVAAHEGDRKSVDPRERWSGPAYRRDVDGDDHMAATAFPSVGIELMSWLPLTTFGTGINNANSGWGYVSPSGREYALTGLSIGTAIVEVTDPGNAQLLTVIPGPTSLWRDIRTYQQYAYAVSEGGSGIQVLDLSQIDNGVVTHVNTVTTGGVSATHTLCIDTASGFLYRAGGSSNGLRIYSLSNPSNPTLVASWNNKYVHEVSVFTYTSGPYAGKQIAFCCDGFNGGFANTGLDILDVTTKSNIKVLGSTSWSQAGYSHQAWPSSDFKYLYVNDELDEQDFALPSTTIVIDIQNLAAPQVVNKFTNGNTAIGHNLYVKGKWLFEANYTSGLRIFNTEFTPTNPSEYYSFDTIPSNDSAVFAGLWNVYPYLPSGTVLGFDIEKGLFVWRVAGMPGPATYCSGKPNSQGCVPQIGFTGRPSFLTPSIDFWITADNVLNKKFGLFFYGLTQAANPFHGGTLCMTLPIKRTAVQASGGSASGTDCTGSFAFEFNDYLQSQADPALDLGTFVFGQYWSRDPNDPAGFTDSFSNAIKFSVEF